MACDVASLLNDACDNDFMAVADNATLSRQVILQLFYNAAGGSETEAELYAQACVNGFDKVAPNETLFRQVLLQLLCNITT